MGVISIIGNKSGKLRQFYEGLLKIKPALVSGDYVEYEEEKIRWGLDPKELIEKDKEIVVGERQILVQLESDDIENDYKKMKVSEAIKKRYSCRSYSSKKVTKGLIKELLELANWAPSANNQQNRQFIVITGKKDREYLAEMNNQKHLGEAPVVILITTKLSKEIIDDYLKSLEEWEMTVNKKKPSDIKITNGFKEEFREMKYKWMISDTAAAAENLILAAVEKGQEL